MTDREFKKYKNNNTFTYYGGYKDAPYEFVFPKSDAWEVVIEKGSYHNPEDITATITKIKGGAPVLPASGDGKGKKKKKKKDKQEQEAAASVEAMDAITAPVEEMPEEKDQ